MSFASNVIIYVPFDSDPILDAVSGQFFNEYGNVPILVNGVFGSAWQMSDQTYIETPGFITISTGLTIGFWLNPINPGVVTNPTSKATLPLMMPIMANASFSGTTNITSNTWTFIIWEETQTNGMNTMQVSLRGWLNSSLVTCTLSSSPYEVGSFHHFWITYNGGAEPVLSLFIDVIEDLGATISGSLPTELSIVSVPLSINDNVIGPAYQIARNSGIIDELVIFNNAQTDIGTIKLAANNGVTYVAVNEIIGTDELDQAAIFDDPGTSQITSVYPNRGRVYVSRNDGKILRGEKLLWELRKDFSNINEMQFLNITKTAADGSVTINSVMTIVDSVVRL